MVIGDFNGDGKPDIAGVGGEKVLNPCGVSNPRLTVWLNSTYQTAVGTNSMVVVNNTTFTYDDVTTGGTTTLTPIDYANLTIYATTTSFSPGRHCFRLGVNQVTARPRNTTQVPAGEAEHLLIAL